MKIYLIRHGQSQGNKLGKYAKEDVPLTAEGFKSLEALAGHPPKGRLFVSPAKRAIQTAEGIFGQRGTIEKRLLEISYGLFEGLTFQEAQEIYPQEMKNWIDNPYTGCPPEGESIESLMKRVEGLLKNWQDLGTDVIGVTHEGVIRAFMALTLGHQDAYFKFYIENASMVTLNYQENFRQILQINYK